VNIRRNLGMAENDQRPDPIGNQQKAWEFLEKQTNTEQNTMNGTNFFNLFEGKKKLKGVRKKKEKPVFCCVLQQQSELNYRSQGCSGFLRHHDCHRVLP